MDLWTRRSNTTSKLSLSTAAPSTTNGARPSNDSNKSYTGSLGRRAGETSSYSTKNPFSAMSPSASSVASPTSGAAGAFGLGMGAFSKFTTNPKTAKTTTSMDYMSAIGAKTPTAEKQIKDVGSKPAKVPLAGPKEPTPPTAHSLRHSWALWFRPPISKSNGFVEYEKTLHPIARFDTMEEFFTVYGHLKRPSTLPLVSDYHIFKKGIRPVWEDDENKKGGKWIVRLKKGVADRYWEDLLFALIGDQFAEASEEVCGAVLSVRNGEDILSIWARNDGGRVLKIRETMRRALGFPPDTKIEWKSHDSSIQQRTAIDDARKEKSQHGTHHTTPARNGAKEVDNSPFSAEKR
ncbi:hypothetical protein QTJ16_006837 [Diplocarpon rosae]|uniref:IF4E-domain-containing protein n=1 Tax=Diplocarpon rosae TaxID=946125 RepID=A0AAD9WBU1_9HELO|nr:hypothetical protein QTJ16_006837 [Diplocarpon rosae]